MVDDHIAFMRRAIVEAELARGKTGDNPWVGCVVTSATGEIVARGHTQGPGEDHAEIVALLEAKARGFDVRGATLYSTLEPCSFHGRTPACARVILDAALGTVVIAMRDPHPRVDGEGARLLRDGGIVVVEGIAEAEVRRQLGSWVFAFHPHEPLARGNALAATHPPEQIASLLAATYDVPPATAAALLARLAKT